MINNQISEIKELNMKKKVIPPSLLRYRFSLFQD